MPLENKIKVLYNITFIFPTLFKTSYSNLILINKVAVIKNIKTAMIIKTTVIFLVFEKNIKKCTNNCTFFILY